MNIIDMQAMDIVQVKSSLERACKRKQVYEICEKFIKDNHISCAETIYQTDWVIENAYNFIEDVCNVVGYYSDEQGE